MNTSATTLLALLLICSPLARAAEADSNRRELEAATGAPAGQPPRLLVEGMQSVPEPGTLFLIATSVAMLLWRRWKLVPGV